MAGSKVDYNGRVASAYASGASSPPEGEAAWKAAVRQHVPSRGRVVDVGAGTGRFAGRLSELAAEVVAVAPAEGMRRAAPAAEGVRWVAGRAESLPIRSGSVDVAWLAFVLHYLDLHRVGNELARVLRPGGRVLVWAVIPDRFDTVPWMRWFPSARGIDEARMPNVEAVGDA